MSTQRVRSMMRSRSRHRGDELLWNPSASNLQLQSRDVGRRFLTGGNSEYRDRRSANYFRGNAAEQKTSDESQAARSHGDQSVANLLGEAQ